MVSAVEVAGLTGIAPVTAALGLSRATFYRRRRPAPNTTVPRSRRRPPRALNEAERVEVLSVLHSEEFVDRAPVEVYTTLLDRGQYLCSPRTMYRVLAENREVRERRNQRRHPQYAKPELVATGPNQVWSWDITKLRTFEKWVYHYLYVLLDIYSRYVVGHAYGRRTAFASRGVGGREAGAVAGCPHVSQKERASSAGYSWFAGSARTT